LTSQTWVNVDQEMLPGTTNTTIMMRVSDKKKQQSLHKSQNVDWYQ